MIIKSKGIVLSYIKYGDTSIIVKIFTEINGYGSYIVQSIRSRRSKKSIGHFQPFSLLDFVLYVKENRNLQYISEFRGYHPLHQLYQNPTKGTITLFLSEIFSKLLQTEQAAAPQLYSFLEDSIKIFDLLDAGVSNFHLQFLLKLGIHLGYATDDINFFFTSMHRILPPASIQTNMERLNKEPYGSNIPLSRAMRNEILDIILHYYQHHTQIKNLKSLKVLRSILN